MRLNTDELRALRLYLQYSRPCKVHQVLQDFNVDLNRRESMKAMV